MLGSKFLIIGAGETGLHLAKELSLMGENVILIEQDSFGGSYLHYNEIPKFWLKHEATRFVSSLEVFRDFESTFQTLIDYRKAIKDILEEKIKATYNFFLNDYKNTKNLQIIAGKASFMSKNLVEVMTKDEEGKDKKEFITFENLILAVGKNTLIKPKLLKDVNESFVHQYSAFSLQSVPSSIVILGCNPDNLEVADIYANLGVKVTIIDSKSIYGCFEQLDIEGVEYLKKYFATKKIETIFEHTIESAVEAKNGINLEFISNKSGTKDAKTKNFDQVYSCVTEFFVDRGMNLNLVGIKHDNNGINVDYKGRTSVQNIWAFGSCNNKTNRYNKLTKVNDFLFKVKRNSKKLNIWDMVEINRDDNTLSTNQINLSINISKPVFTIGTPETIAQNLYKPDIGIEIVQKIEQEGFIKIWFRQSNGQILGACLTGEIAQYRHYINLAMSKNVNIMEVVRYILSD
jgi:pyruvate/2-oxoglutarate dehydrogenase complex dihydrolipoamide dehydrogenase (E3) component